MATWFRAYAEARHNPKIQRLPPATFRAWFNLLCLTCERDGALPPVDVLAFELRMSVPATRKIVAELVEKRLLDVLGDGFLPHDWNERQFKADVSTPRVRAFRERRSKRNETVSGNVEVNGFETPPEAETNTEERSPPVAPPTTANGAARTGTRLPAGFVMPDEWMEAARAARDEFSLPPVNLDLEAAKFRDHWAAKSGKDATKADWRLTWLNWARRADAVRGPPAERPSEARAFMSAAARYTGRSQ